MPFDVSPVRQRAREQRPRARRSWAPHTAFSCRSLAPFVLLLGFAASSVGCATADATDGNVAPSKGKHDTGEQDDAGLDDETSHLIDDSSAIFDSDLADSIATDGGTDVAVDTQPEAPRDTGPVCGNGAVEGPEECDDGNKFDLDGCSAACVVECAGKKDPTTHHCYQLSQNQQAWSDAEGGCGTLASDFHLATVTSAEEAAIVGSFGEPNWIGSSDGHEADATDSTSGAFTWINGEPMTYTNWHSGEPNNSSHDCGFWGLGTCKYEHCMMTYASGEWNDNDCRTLLSYVCERDPAGVKLF